MPRPMTPGARPRRRSTAVPAPVPKVRGAMRRDVITVAPGDPLVDLEQLMRLARVRSLPVVERGRLAGMVAYTQVVRALIRRRLATLLQEPRDDSGPPLVARDVMEPPAALLEPETPLARGGALVAEAAAGCLPVVERDGEGPRLVGLLIETDLLRRAFEPFAEPPAFEG